MRGIQGKNEEKKIINLFRDDLKKISPYTPTKTKQQMSAQAGLPLSQIVKLDAAENSLLDGWYRKNALVGYAGYPDPFSTEIRRALGRSTGFGRDWIACGNGSDELIDILIALFVKKNEEVLIAPPTFPMYDFFARVRGVRVKKVLRDIALEIPMKGIIKAVSSRTKLVFIDSPGNPEGTVTRSAQLVSLLRRNVIVVVDEAYFEFYGETVASLVRSYPNLIVLRTLSKWAGLAGLRFGYMIAYPEIVKRFLSIKPPYNVNSIAQSMALYALKKRRELLRKTKSSVQTRCYLKKALSQFTQLEVLKGEGAFVLVRVRGRDAGNVARVLEKKGVLVKVVRQPMLENALRIDLAPRKKINKLILCLKGIL